MKILLVSNAYPSAEKPYSGIFVKNQYERLLSLKDPDDEIDIAYLKRRFTSFIGSVAKYSRFFLQFIPYLFSTYEVVHLHFFYPLISLMVIYKIFHPSTQLVVTFHGGDVPTSHSNQFMRHYYRWLAQYIDHTIAVSESLKAPIENILNRKVDTYLCAGVDEQTFYPQPDTPKQYDFLFTGSFYKIKGVDLLLKAIKLIDQPQIRYCFVGSGEYASAIERLQEKYNISLFKNLTQKELREKYTAAKFLILPSRQESFGLVVTEAFFCGTPAIVSPTGVLPKQVQHKKNGFVLRKNTPQILSQVMQKALSLSSFEYKKLAQSALQSNKDYKLTNVCTTLLQTYQKLSSK